MEIKAITAKELKEKLDQNLDICLIDCRENSEWEEGHIDKAILIPLGKIEEDSKNLNSLDQEIITQCKKGKRSIDAAGKLKAKGFTNISYLEGGIEDWIKSGFACTK